MHDVYEGYQPEYDADTDQVVWVEKEERVRGKRNSESKSKIEADQRKRTLHHKDQKKRLRKSVGKGRRVSY